MDGCWKVGPLRRLQAQPPMRRRNGNAHIGSPGYDRYLPTLVRAYIKRLRPCVSSAILNTFT